MNNDNIVIIIDNIVIIIQLPKKPQWATYFFELCNNNEKY